jgi:4-diphosphocytidyl-2-C-methyl-D-erythritol kinase
VAGSAAGARWPAPAKINLFLHVTGRRADGYHELQTVFQFLDLSDEIGLRVRSDGIIKRLNDPAGIPEEADLVVRAARLLQSVAGVASGADIELHKRIPVGGGLGGGSSDAATVLVALNRLWNAGLDNAALCELGLQLGADVPVFVRGRSAWAEGVGERLTDVDLGETCYVVVNPGCHVSTAEVFSAPTLTRNTAPLKIRDLVRSWDPGELPCLVPRELLARAGNDCESVVRKAHPEVGDVLGWLSRFGEARMTGTGASVFVPVTGEHDALGLLRQLPEPWSGVLARGTNTSPLLARVSAEGV